MTYGLLEHIHMRQRADVVRTVHRQGVHFTQYHVGFYGQRRELGRRVVRVQFRARVRSTHQNTYNKTPERILECREAAEPHARGTRGASETIERRN
jgi:hypothetical protein